MRIVYLKLEGKQNKLDLVIYILIEFQVFGMLYSAAAQEKYCPIQNIAKDGATMSSGQYFETMITDTQRPNILGVC